MDTIIGSALDAKWTGMNANAARNREYYYDHDSLVFYDVPFIPATFMGPRKLKNYRSEESTGING